ncbi:MAG: CocE/NonD family hydrolase [Pseudomonadota bacterium]|nr:CocE/NonD family hydrolase [Pseudomonadota bacterium]
MTQVRDGMMIDWDVPIEMDDGIVLRADVYRPETPGKYPVLISYGPYGKGLAFYDAHFKVVWDSLTEAYPEVASHSSNKYMSWELPDPERWTREGYICVRVDSRGSGRSPGELDMFSPRQAQDFHDCIEWAGAQDWCTGNVGISGISYYASNQWQVASLQPKSLKAMFAFEGASDVYRELARHGGILTTFWDNLLAQVENLQHGMGKRGLRSKVTGDLVSGPDTLPPEELAAKYRNIYKEFIARETEDEYYTSRNPDWSKVNVPFVSAANIGGQALHLRGNMEAFANAASEDKYLEIHGGEHWTHFFTDYGFDMQKAFFDCYLKGDTEAWKDHPRVYLQVRKPDDTLLHRGEEEWPLARTEWTNFYLDARNMRLTTTPPEAESTVSYAGFGDGVTFLSDPFEETTEITGPSNARLTLSSETEDADVFLVLRLFGPDMKECNFIGSADAATPLTHGWLRASHRKLDPEKSLPWRPFHSHDEIQKLTPGERVDLEVEVWPTAIEVPKGYRIALSVQGKDYTSPAVKLMPKGVMPRISNNGVGFLTHQSGQDRPAHVFGKTVTLHTGAGGEDAPHVMLPVIPSK